MPSFLSGLILAGELSVKPAVVRFFPGGRGWEFTLPGQPLRHDVHTPFEVAATLLELADQEKQCR